ncbi:hypothetical protein TNCV_3239671 [Trichonephila clavipes]|nr:hypothetical protein TNCV_3239671 [Trichonephila clavipes]
MLRQCDVLKSMSWHIIRRLESGKIQRTVALLECDSILHRAKDLDAMRLAAQAASLEDDAESDLSARACRFYTRTFGDGPRNFEPWSSDEDDTGASTASPNKPTLPMGGHLSFRQI